MTDDQKYLIEIGKAVIPVIVFSATILISVMVYLWTRIRDRRRLRGLLLEEVGFNYTRINLCLPSDLSNLDEKIISIARAAIGQTKLFSFEIFKSNLTKLEALKLNDIFTMLAINALLQAVQKIASEIEELLKKSPRSDEEKKQVSSRLGQIVPLLVEARTNIRDYLSRSRRGKSIVTMVEMHAGLSAEGVESLRKAVGYTPKT